MGPATSRGQCAQQPARGVPAVSVEVGWDRRAGGIPGEKCPKFRRLLPDVRGGVGHGTQTGILESGKAAWNRLHFVCHTSSSGSIS
jgi:hypothetical protein